MYSNRQMPELPEVETIVRRLLPKIKGKNITRIKVLREKSWQGDAQLVLNNEVVDVYRRAKLTIIKLAKNDYFLLVHLKMTGQLIYVGADQERVGGGHPTADWVAALPSKHTRIIFDLSDGAKLFFNDMRVFGWIKTLDQPQLEAELGKYGPDVIDENLTAKKLWEKLQKKNVSIKQAIMDNKIMAGVGNIYACDGLNLARLSPTRLAKSLTLVGTDKLLVALREVVNLGIKLGGATISDYTDVDGFAGQYQTVCRVYGKEGLACPNCGGKIKRIKQGGRSTFFCPDCQK